jgi:hypothetical protein
MRGESEPMRAFNVLLSEAAVEAEAVKSGISNGNRALTEGEKVRARYKLILKQTKDIQGDYARTADSMANKQRKATEAAEDSAASLGDSLAPILAEVFSVLGGVARRFDDLPGPIKTGTAAMLALIAVASPLASTMALVTRGLAVYKTRQIAAAAATRTSATAMTGFNAATATANARLPGLIGSLKALAAAAITAKTIEFTVDAVRELAEGGDVEKTRDELDRLARGVVDGTATLGEYRAAVKAAHEELGEMENGLARLLPQGFAPRAAEIDRLNATAAAYEALAKTLDENKAEHKKLKQALDDGSKSLREFTKVTKKDLDSWRESTIKDLGAGSDAVKKLAEDTDVSVDEIKDALKALIDAQVDFRKNWKEVFDVVGKDTDDLVNFLSEKLGIEAPEVLALLANANDKEIKRILGLWKDWRDDAGRTNRVVSGDLGDIGEKGKESGDNVKAGMDEAVEGFKRARKKGKEVVDVLKDILKFSDVEIAMQFRTLNMPSGDGLGRGVVGGSAVRMAQAAIDAVPGPQAITSTFRGLNERTASGNLSYHADPNNPAADIGGTRLMDVAQWLMKTYGLGAFRELIFSPLGFSVRHGQIVPPVAVADHYDHVHVADRGKILRGPATIMQGPITEAHIPLDGPAARGWVDALGKRIAEVEGKQGDTIINIDMTGAIVSSKREAEEWVNDALTRARRRRGL